MAKVMQAIFGLTTLVDDTGFNLHWMEPTREKDGVGFGLATRMGKHEHQFSISPWTGNAPFAECRLNFWGHGHRPIGRFGLAWPDCAELVRTLADMNSMPREINIRPM